MKTILPNIFYLINKKSEGNKKGQTKSKFDLSSEVGVAGFEPTTSTSQMWRDTGLRYTPMMVSPLFCGEGGIRTRGTVTSTTV
jgi:hypothetical protein